eukprot:m.41164 g.41164  ORF g.41164 m.41164 type:complete len:194 (+) comp10404_c0_seq7:48-629(+)
MTVAEPINKEKFIEFLTQACAGPIMGLYRAPDMMASIGDNYGMVIRTLLARYFNSIWLNLLRDDDEYVTTMFSDINHRSPVCLIHALFAVGTKVLPNEPFPSVAVGDDGNEVAVPVDMMRSMVHQFFQESIEKEMNENDILNHVCTGKTLQEERERWQKGGSQDEDFFSFNAPAQQQPQPPTDGAQEEGSGEQ